MTSHVLITHTDLDQGWAHARLLATALHDAGADVVRITGCNEGLSGALVATGIDATALRDRLDKLRSVDGIGDHLKGIATEVIEPARFDALTTEPLRPVSVALFGSAGAPYHQLDVFASSGFDVAPIGSQAVRDGALDGVDVFVMPGGGWEFMDGQLSRLGVEGAKAIDDFVLAGGCYLSSCAGTHSILRQSSEAVNEWHPAYAVMPKLSAESWLKGSRNTHFVRSPGIGVIRTRTPDRAHPAALGLPDEFDCTYYNGPIILPEGEGYVSVLDCLDPYAERFTPGEGLFGSDEVVFSETAIAEAGRQRYSAGGVQPHGKGWLAGFGLHPEFGCEPSMLHWGVSARLLVNIAEWTGGSRPAHTAIRFDASEWAAETAETPAPDELRDTVQMLLGEIEAGFERLAAMPDEEVAPWLDREIARSAFGVDPRTLWHSSVREGGELARAMMARIDVWSASCAALRERAASEPPRLAQRIDAVLENATRLLSLPAVDAGPQDLGFKGLPALLSDVRGLLDTLTVEGELHPFKAVAMSYLSAFGRLTAASLTLNASQAILARALLAGEVAALVPPGR